MKALTNLDVRSFHKRIPRKKKKLKKKLMEKIMNKYKNLPYHWGHPVKVNYMTVTVSATGASF